MIAAKESKKVHLREFPHAKRSSNLDGISQARQKSREIPNKNEFLLLSVMTSLNNSLSTTKSECHVVSRDSPYFEVTFYFLSHHLWQLSSINEPLIHSHTEIKWKAAVETEKSCLSVKIDLWIFFELQKELQNCRRFLNSQLEMIFFMWQWNLMRFSVTATCLCILSTEGRSSQEISLKNNYPRGGHSIFEDNFSKFLAIFQILEIFGNFKKIVANLIEICSFHPWNKQEELRWC